jgi:hypothetical protein
MKNPGHILGLLNWAWKINICIVLQHPHICLFWYGLRRTESRVSFQETTDGLEIGPQYALRVQEKRICMHVLRSKL